MAQKPRKRDSEILKTEQDKQAWAAFWQKVLTPLEEWDWTWYDSEEGDGSDEGAPFV